jgi:hypothetical protein
MLASDGECEPNNWGGGEEESRGFYNKLEIKRLANAVKKPATKCSYKNWCVMACAYGTSTHYKNMTTFLYL